MIHRYLPLLLAMATLTAACSGGSGSDVQVFGGSTDIINNRITLHEGSVTVRASGAPDATVDAHGQLAIDGHDVTVNDAQRALLQRYNAAAQAMRTDAIATGKAGVATATKAIGAAAGKITGSANADEASAKADEAAADVKAAAAKICDDLVSMKTAQDELATQLEAFKPYAHALDDANIEKCRKDTRH
ncbi:MAG TPA: DUF2884 family protein [Dyella sp.]|uniref:DUF2884 family protein n=1 Tax=Dyella sp. TaxID=1869338 RepID=UPI002D795159|nr:DUF2884 family protein [Dyella sp.]HET6555543.1 DUF2884 family protein [Dyella sp.]